MQSMAEPLKCPQCGTPLEKGYIQAPRGLSWDNKKHRWETLTVEELIDDLYHSQYPTEKHIDANNAAS